MAPLKIFLDGKSSITRQPERGALSFIVKAAGPSREGVSRKVTETSNEINRLFKELSPKSETGETIAGSPVTSFSSTSLQTRSHVPTDKSGEPLPTVYHATLALNALFQDFTTLNEVVGKLVSYPNIEIQSLEWCLTEATQKDLSSESRKEAMRDAIQKANDYAEVVGREVFAVEIRDSGSGVNAGRYNPYHSNIQGMMPQQMQQMQQQQVARSTMLAQQQAASSAASSASFNSGGSTSLDLSPQLIRYTNSVNVEFRAADI
ncbi:hypothetical protein PENANT_c008G08813 [Penicillium antarcticum]|uniref:Uncharacterized protein n=1 Tax=Penicillium antarcticum TaxID=416450 RepID=A0A1V6QA53_9EURO|nr:uncharacterized protein N7508_007066 [Penicillium antarcticum]KAJ5302203.1 hypothetical protein N7508_007066 [Penicillium antarcticum]OQD86111.1 hypothetical protein PENANT_c008G08813 [Penicillium antarcticum]